MATPTPRICIVILNWNGWRDTIECLESIRRLKYPDFFVVVVDNGSTDDSLKRMSDWAQSQHGVASAGTEAPLTALSHTGTSSLPGPLPTSVRSQLAKNGLRTGAIFLLRSADNLGFAAGCNLGMRIGVTIGAKYLWLLNNDTIVAPDSLRVLGAFLEEHGEFVGVTGQIRLYREPNVIWNCGGKLLPLGFKRYAYSGAPAMEAPQTGYARISFMTGCAVLLRTSLMERIGFLSEQFFFGEEDFELCQRLKRTGMALACCYGALIYHKVGASISIAASRDTLAKTHIYYLNRFIHMRTYWSSAFWQCWRYGYCLYIIWLIRRSHGIGLRMSLTMLRGVLRESEALDRVDRVTFTRLMSGA